MMLKTIFATLHEHPRLVAFAGTVAGWFSADNIAHAKDAAQFTAAIIAALVSLCALILTAPKAIAEVRRWFGRG